MTREKNLYYDRLVQPNSFYCTFEHASTKLEAEKIRYFELFGEKCKIKTALEPTNIYWENRSVSKLNRIIRGVIVLTAMSIWIWYIFYRAGSTGIYFMMTLKYLAFTPGVSCKNVLNNYSENLPTLAHQELEIISSSFANYGTVSNGDIAGID